MPVPEQIFGWSADPYDPQDEEYKFAPAVYAPGTDIKPVVYNITPQVKNQLQEGSCVFHAATEAMEAAEHPAEAVDAGGVHQDFSSGLT